MIQTTIQRVLEVLPHPESDNLNINKIGGGFTVVSNKEDGKSRYNVGDLVVYVPENAIVPDYLLRQGYWDDAKGKGILAGGKGNRVKGRKFAGVVSEGLVFPLVYSNSLHAFDYSIAGRYVIEPTAFDEFPTEAQMIGMDVTEILGITEYIPQL